MDIEQNQKQLVIKGPVMRIETKSQKIRGKRKWKGSIFDGFGHENEEENRIVARTVLLKGFLRKSLGSLGDPSIPHKITYESKV